MILNILMRNFFSSCIQILIYIVLDPLYIFKISFLWFLIAVTASYLYFLWTHQSYVVQIRKDLIFLLAKSLAMGLISAALLIGIYEFILQMICMSKFFSSLKGSACTISLATSKLKLFRTIAFCEIILASFWACEYIEPFLEQWYPNRIVHGYHWFIIATAAIALSFLWLISI